MLLKFDDFFKFTDVYGTLEDKIYSALDMLFLSMTAVMDRATGYSNKHRLSTIQTIILDFVNYLLLKLCGLSGSKMSIYKSNYSN